MATKETGKRLDVVDVLKPVFGKKNPLNRYKQEPRQLTQQEKANLKRLQARAIKLWKADVNNALELGRTLWTIKKIIGHGKFAKWWRDHRLTQSRVSYCLRLAQGKVEANKRKRASAKIGPANEAAQSVTKELKELFRRCAHDNRDALAIREGLRSAINATVAQAAALAGWKLTREVETATSEFERALNKYISVVTGTLSKAQSVGR